MYLEFCSVFHFWLLSVQHVVYHWLDELKGLCPFGFATLENFYGKISFQSTSL